MLGLITQLVVKVAALLEAEARAARRAVHRLLLAALVSAGAVVLAVVGLLTLGAGLVLALAPVLGVAWTLLILGAALLLAAAAGLQLARSLVGRRR